MFEWWPGSFRTGVAWVTNSVVCRLLSRRGGLICISDLIFLYKLGILDCSSNLFHKIKFLIPRGTSSGTLFGRRYQPTVFAHRMVCRDRSGSIRRGKVAPRIDFFSGAYSTFRRNCAGLVFWGWGPTYIDLAARLCSICSCIVSIHFVILMLYILLFCWSLLMVNLLLLHRLIWLL